jgi:AraC-like DNA-binding protein
MRLRSVQFFSGSTLKLPVFWQAVGHERITSEKYRFEGIKRPYLKLLWQLTLSGTGTLQVANHKPVLLPKGASFIAQFPSDHNYYFSKRHDHWEFIYIILAGPAMPELLKPIRNRPVMIFQRELDPRIQDSVIKLTKKEEDISDDPWQCMAEAGEVLALLLREASLNEDRISTSRRIPNDPQILEPIVKNPGLTIDKNGWAQEKRRSRFQLYRQVKAITGISPKDVRNQQRLKEALRFMRRPGITIKDVSTLAGFRDQAYFCRFFKKQTGFTPTQWRQQFTDVVE